MTTGTNTGVGDRSGYAYTVDQVTEPFTAGRAAGPAVMIAGVAAGGVATVLLPNADRIGIGVTLSAAALAVPGLLSARRRGRADGRPFGRVNAATVAVAAGLLLIPTLRAADWLAVLCLLAAAGLVAVVQLDVRRLAPIVLAGPLIAWAGLRTPGWVLTSVQEEVPSLPRPSGRAARAWARGLLLGAVVVLVVGALLASADVVFARLVDRLWPSVDVGQVPAYAITFVVTTGLALAGGYAGAHRVRRRWLAPTAGPDDQPRHPAEWLLPLVLAGVVLALFLVVQVTALFGGAAETVLREEGLTYADRARQGFGQLTVVTLILVALLAWAGRAGAGHRRLLAAAGGPLLALILLLAASALRRLWLYDDAYGWTVRRVNAAAFEIWLVVALLGLGVLWLTRRTGLAPRLVIGSAGAGLLCLALVNPEAMVARADVHRYEQSGYRAEAIDVEYLAALSADAAPALSELPPAERQLVLAHLRDSYERLPDTWRTWNLARHHAQGVLAPGGSSS
ncbi:DUF4153 domain-containing protein [Spongisporangium articulatum]|uniref:DUF4153 domain-containing protein n=1 Tax=Spongisporangium articulatum TaxID=3362603 RepID=A0ABW8AMF2_9ACTN